jgi:signal transduction histidine kinase
MEVPGAAGPQNGGVRTRLQRLWRAAEPTLWPDVALAAVLGVAIVWLTIRTSDAVIGPAPPGPPAGPLVDPGPLGDVGVAGFRRDWDNIIRDAFLNLLITTALIGRRRWPLVCFAVQFTVLIGLDPDGNVLTLVALLIGAYSLALLSIGVLLTTAVAIAVIQTNTWPRLPGWAGVFALLLPVGLTGVAIRAARGRADASEQRTEALRREQEAATLLAVAQERARIAREMHDVVSHHVSVMTIQAGAAGKVLDADPELARGALSAIEASGRETMTELRHLLGVFSPEPAEELLRPPPGLDQLDALVDNVRRAGQPVSVRRAPADLSRGMDLTAYRVVQEALTNALRYAPGARTSIDITTEPPADPADLVIEVTNDAPPPGAERADAGSGAGLLGLAERLRLYGGTLETGRRVGGGFRVRAQLPLEAAS